MNRDTCLGSAAELCSFLFSYHLLAALWKPSILSISWKVKGQLNFLHLFSLGSFQNSLEIGCLSLCLISSCQKGSVSLERHNIVIEQALLLQSALSDIESFFGLLLVWWPMGKLVKNFGILVFHQWNRNIFLRVLVLKWRRFCPDLCSKAVIEIWRYI